MSCPLAKVTRIEPSSKTVVGICTLVRKNTESPWELLDGCVIECRIGLIRPWLVEICIVI